MITSKDSDSSDGPKGLAKAVADSAHPAMRLLGGIALSRGFSQESLAREYKRRFGARINGANVHSHFTNEHPTRQTIDRYAEILGISSDQLHVLEHGRLSGDRERLWEQRLLRNFSLYATEFEPGTDAEITEALRDSETRSRVLAAMALPTCEPGPEWSSIPPTIAAAAAALMPTLDLRERVASESPMLFKIYVDVIELLGSPTKAQAYIRACSAMLELEGVDTQPMRNYVRRRTRDTPDGLHEVTVVDGSSVITKTYAADPRAPWVKFMPEKRHAIIGISKPASSRRKGDNP